MKTDLLFRFWPYIAVAVFAAGLTVRYARRRSGAARGQALESRELFGGRKWPGIAMLLLLLGHLTGLLFPNAVLLWNEVPWKLDTLEGVAFALGAATLAGWANLMWRQFARSSGSIGSQVADAVFLSLLFVAIASGLLTAVLYKRASSWAVLTLTPYALSVLRGQPATALVSGMPFVVQVHVFASLAAGAALPFTRLAPLLVLALERALAVLFRPASIFGERTRAAAEAWTHKHKPALWIWPEED